MITPAENQYSDMMLEELKELRRRNTELQHSLEVVRFKNNAAYSPDAVRVYGTFGAVSLLGMLRLRLPEWGSSHSYMVDHVLPPPPFEYVGVYQNKIKREIAVLLIKDGKEVILRDDEAMFPSDRLITQIRVLTP